MKKLLILLSALVFTIVSVNAQKLSKIAPKVIAIGIGEKNLSFDESQFPDIDVYYTPTLIVNNYGLTLEERVNEAIKYETIPFYKSKKMVGEPYSGTPKFIIDANSDHTITDTYMLFDKSGLCYSIGYDITFSANNKSLGNDLSAVVKKGKIVKPAKKPYTTSKTQSIIGNKLGDFPIQTIDGENLELNSLLGEEPVLVVFFYLDPELNATGKVLTDDEAKSISNTEITYYEINRQSAYDNTYVLRDAEKQFFDMKFKKYERF